MKRYILFVGDDYYPVGGARDLAGHFDTLVEARKAGEAIVAEDNYEKDWYNVLDTKTELALIAQQHNFYYMEQELFKRHTALLKVAYDKVDSLQQVVDSLRGGP